MNPVQEALVPSLSIEASNNNNVPQQHLTGDNDVPLELANSGYWNSLLIRLQQEVDEANSNISGDSNNNQIHANMANGSSLAELVNDQDFVDQPVIDEDMRTNLDYIDHQIPVAQQQPHGNENNANGNNPECQVNQTSHERTNIQQQPMLNEYSINERNIGHQANQPMPERANILPPARPFKDYFVQLPNGELVPLHPTLPQQNNLSILKRKRTGDTFECTTNAKKQRTSYVTNNYYIVDSMRSSSESSEDDSTDYSSDEFDSTSDDFEHEFDHEDDYSYSDYEDDYY